MITNVNAVTVFNARLDRGTRRKIFIPTVIRGVSYVEGKGSKVADNGVWSDDVQYKIRVPKYIRDLSYAKLDDEEAVKYWTIQKGDLMVPEEYAGGRPLLYEDEITVWAAERGLDLISITEYADDTAGGSLYTRHWRIGGK